MRYLFYSVSILEAESQAKDTCQNPDVHPVAQNISDITDYKL
jgi:hypothetical protein